jgi:hypothetical protein
VPPISAKKLLGNKMNNPSLGYKLKEIPAIEFLRFFSALMILVFHYVHFTYKGTSLPQNLSNLNLPFYNFLWIFYEFGKYAVQIFWSISGFIFFLKYKNLIAEKLISAKDFFILRLSRLYPLHFLTLLIVLLSSNWPQLISQRRRPHRCGASGRWYSAQPSGLSSFRRRLAVRFLGSSLITWR